MHLILNAHSSNEHYNGNCDYALVELTPALAEKIRSRVALARQVAKQDSNLYDVCFWGSMAEFFDHNILESCLNAISGSTSDDAARDWLADFEQQGYALVPAGVDLDAHEAQRTECDQVIIRVASYSHRLEFSVVWTASPKYADLDVTTSELPLTAMEELLAATIPQTF
jgi:hypothetical protein